MKLNVRFQEQDETFSGIQETDERIRVGFGSVQTSTYTERDYEKLINKPSINSIPLQGNLTSADLGIAASFPAEGSVGDVLMKTSNANDGVSWVTPASSAEQDNTRPITAAAVYTEIGNINVLLATI